MKKAIGTSLIIIAIKSILGFSLADALTTHVDWNFLLAFTGLAVAGIFIGVYINKFVNGQKLKKWFAYFIILMAIFIFIMEFFD